MDGLGEKQHGAMLPNILTGNETQEILYPHIMPAHHQAMFAFSSIVDNK